MRIAVIGTGYVGLISGLCLSLKHKIKCVDISVDIVRKINLGIPHIFEENLKDLLKKQLSSGNFEAISLDKLNLKHIDVVLICVGTPSLENGKCDLKFIKSAVSSLIPLLEDIRHKLSIILKSTAPPGTVNSEIINVIQKKYPKNLYPNFGFGMNPEFLREGSAIADFLNPDRIIIGSDSKISEDHLLEIYKDFNCPKIVVNSSTAEMIKYVNNSLLALQISAVNEYSTICEEIDNVNIKEVMKGVLYDKRWQSNADSSLPPSIHNYLKAGCGFGGSCFPKDVKALSNFAKELNLNTPILDSTIIVNKNQPLVIYKKISKFIDIPKSKILILGIAFKPDTDDIRESPSLSFIKNFRENGAKIYVHDPVALDNMRKHQYSKYLQDDSYIDNFQDIISKVNVILLVTNWSVYSNLPSILSNTKKLIFDTRGIFNASDFPSCKYMTTGYK